MASELRRRDVLRASGALALAGAAGCLDDVIEEIPGEGNGSGTDPDGNHSAPADGNPTETPEGTDDPGTEGTTNGTDGNGSGESNDSDGSDAAETPEETDDSNETDTSVEDGEGDDSEGSDGEDRENGSEDGDDGNGEANDEEEPDGAEGKEDGGESGEGSEGDAEGGDDGADGEGTETEDGDGDQTGEDEDGENEDGDSEEETPSGDPPEGFVTYANEELGYAVAHPKGWEVEESGEEVYVGDPGSRRELGILTLDAAEFGSSDALAAAFLENLEADYENVEVREEGDRTLASGQDARLLDVAYGDPEGDRSRRRSRMLFATDPDTDAGYVAEVAAPVEAFDDAFAERAETMLESFRIGEGG